MGVTLPRQTDHYCNEKLRKHRDGTPDRLRGGSLHPSPAAPRSSTRTSEALGPGRPATAYMVARASEHLTADPTRPAESLVTQRPALHLLLTAARHQSKRNRTVCSPTWGSLQSIQRTRRRPVSEAAHLRRSANRTPAQQAQPPRRSRCARNDRAAH